MLRTELGSEVTLGSEPSVLSPHWVTVEWPVLVHVLERFFH